MLKLPSPFLSASVKVCFSHVMTRRVKESQHEDSGHLLFSIVAAFDEEIFRAKVLMSACQALR